MRRTNRAGGLEGGMTTGMPLIMTAAMKPIPTQIDPLNTVNIDTLEVDKASTERSDVCAVPAASVVAEAEVAFIIAQAYLDRIRLRQHDRYQGEHRIVQEAHQDHVALSLKHRAGAFVAERH